jgi:hypothetical protein
MECAAAVMLGRPLSLNYNEIDAEVGPVFDSTVVQYAPN